MHPAGSLIDHDHGCLMYASVRERLDAAVAFAATAFSEDAKFVYLTADRRPERAVDELAASGLADCAARVAGGQLEVRLAEEAYLSSGRFRPAETIDLLRSEVEAATDAGWSGLRVAGEMRWATAAGCDTASVIDYETAVDGLFRSTRAAALCMYDRRLFDRAACRDVARVHQLVLAQEAGEAHPEWPLCRVERGPDGTIRLVGEVDFANAHAITASLTLEAGRRDAVRLDLSELDFVDAHTFGRLAELRRELRATGRDIAIVSASPAVDRVARLLGDPCRDWQAWEER